MTIENKCPKCKMQDYDCDDMEDYSLTDAIVVRTWYCWCSRCHVQWDYVEHYRLFASEIKNIEEMQDDD